MKIALVDSGLGLIYVLQKIIDKNIKHDIHLLFTSIFPLGQYEDGDIKKEVKRLEKIIKKSSFDMVFIMCNTLSCFMKDKNNYIKILNFNKIYLKGNKKVLPVGTIHTIKYLNKGYEDKNLAKDIEENNEIGIIEDITNWPKADEYLLCCTHYILALDYISKIHPKSKIIDFSNNVFNIISSLPQEKELNIDYGDKKDLVKRYLKF